MTRIEDLSLNLLQKDTTIPQFKSSDSDLNEFLMLEAKDSKSRC